MARREGLLTPGSRFSAVGNRGRRPPGAAIAASLELTSYCASLRNERQSLLAAEMGFDVHPLVEDADDVDPFAGFPVEDEVGLNGEFPIVRANASVATTGRIARQLGQGR